MTTGTLPLDILAALDDRELLGAHTRDPETWRAWRAFLAALFGLEMDDEMLATFRSHTGRETAPTTPAREGWLVVGRRGGKSFISALVAVFLAAFRDYRSLLAPGERATVMVIAQDRRQARTVFRYIAGLIDASPLLAGLVESRRAESIELAGRVTIEVHTASFRAVRGYTIAACIADEVAFWRAEDSANPDVEILDAVRPAMSTIPGALLLCLSTPYARRGALWGAYRAHYAQDGDPVLVWRADTRAMNPTVAAHVIAEAFERDAAVAAAEYGAEFRRDLEGFVSVEAIDACTRAAPIEYAPAHGAKHHAFIDMSGGGRDASAVAIAHADGERVLIDAVRWWRSPNPHEHAAEITALLRRYGVAAATSDRYGARWPAETFERLGITVTPSELTKSELYGEFLPRLNAATVELPDVPRLRRELLGLERRTRAGGRDTIDHSPGAHDDVANAVAGAVFLASRPEPGRSLTVWNLSRWSCDPPRYYDPSRRAWREREVV